MGWVNILIFTSQVQKMMQQGYWHLGFGRRTPAASLTVFCIMVEKAINGPSLRENGPLQKSLWTSEEDAILVEYISKHGEGNWNSIQKRTGLARCGNSCRLRWINHLRPNLKKGAITPEEEERIVKLHARLGNKWAQIVTELPGRTDNEIKNFWNTRAKRRLRSGLPIYPPELFPEQNQQNMDLGTFLSGNNTLHHSFSPNYNFVVPTMEFGSSVAAQHLYTPQLFNIPPNNIPNIPTSNLLAQDLNSTFYPSNALQQSESLFQGFGATVCDGFAGEIQCPTNASVQTTPYDHIPEFAHPGPTSAIPDPRFYHPAPWSAIPVWHDNLNGASSSEIASMNLEVPSIQTRQSLGSLSSPFPSLETVDNLTYSPETGNTQSLNLSPESYRLLETMLFNEPQSNSCLQTCNDSAMPVHEMGTSSNDLHEIQPEAYGAPNSALGSSFLSFNEYTPISRNLLDEPSQSINAVPGDKGKAVVEPIPWQYGESSETAYETIFPSLDFLPEPNFFDPDSDFTNYPF